MIEEKKLEMLLKLMVANVEHARHAENERLTFNSIYIVFLAGFFSFVFDPKEPKVAIFSLLLLLAISLIGLLLTKRWSDVFDGHMDKAKEISLLIYGDESVNENAKDVSLLIYGIEDQNKYEPIYNKYYYFKHDYYHRTTLLEMKELMQTNPHITYAQAAEQINFKSPWHRLCKIRTRNLFYCFYGIVICTLSLLFLWYLNILLC